jgi:hypothetical protein
VGEHTFRFALCMFTVLVGASDSAGRMAGSLGRPAAVGQPRPTSTSELARTSEFVGFIDAYPQAIDPGAAWKQWIFVNSVDALKGDLGRGTGTNRYPDIAADHSGFPGYPTWFAGKGEYLVFLRHESIEGKVVWATTAVFAIEYRPDAAGTIVGRLHGEGQKRRAPNVGEVRALLRRMMSSDRTKSDAERVLDQVLGSAALSGASLTAREPATFEQRFMQVKVLAGGIRLGTRRADIKKVFPEEDGGLSSPGRARFYAGSEVMVEVPFNQQGGKWSAENRVTGPLRVYRSLMHFD